MDLHAIPTLNKETDSILIYTSQDYAIVLLSEYPEDYEIRITNHNGIVYFDKVVYHSTKNAIKTKSNAEYPDCKQYFIPDLTPDTEYTCTIIKLNDNESAVYQTGTFVIMNTESSATNLVNTPIFFQKIIRDGQIFILRNNKTYSITGNEIQ